MIILGMGSNCGDRLSFLRRAIQRLKSAPEKIQVQGISPIYESPALLLPDSPTHWDRPYLNLAVLCSSSLPSIDLLKFVKKTEADIGRQNRGRWAPREIDIDILARDSEVFTTEELTLPHAGLDQRPFAYLPFGDLAPEWELPNSGPHHRRRISELRTNSSTHRSNLTLTELVGILNVTPDSFSDGGRHQCPQAALETARTWSRQGIRILDLGAESTRPGATTLTPREERSRLEPLLEALTEDSELKENHLILSLDSRNPEVADWAVSRGVHWINDVSGFENPEMARIAANSGATAVFMHSLSVPSRKDLVIPEGIDPIDLLLKWGDQKIRSLLELGISREQLVFDPGLGFGKTQTQNWEIIRHFRRFHELGVKTLVGHSRKSFLSVLGNFPAHLRDPETATLSVDLYEKGADYLRVHDPILNARSLKTWSHANGVIRCQI